MKNVCPSAQNVWWLQFVVAVVKPSHTQHSSLTPTAAIMLLFAAFLVLVLTPDQAAAASKVQMYMKDNNLIIKTKLADGKVSSRVTCVCERGRAKNAFHPPLC